MKNTRKQPQRVPPPLLSEDERFEGMAILEEFPGDEGLVLWKTFRGVQLWAEMRGSGRSELFSDDAFAARQDHLDHVALEEIAEPLAVLADMHRRRLATSSVIARCKAIERWADETNRGNTALEFSQLAALIGSKDADLAVNVARRGRDMAQYARAESWYWQAIVRARKAREWESYVLSMLGLGVTHRLRGNYPAARRNFERGLRRAVRQSLGGYVPLAYHELTVVAVMTDNLKRTVQYGSRAVEAYPVDHPRLPWLGHDVAIFWMNRGYFQSALDVFEAIPSNMGTAGDSLSRYANTARAAGAIGDKWKYDEALTQVRIAMDDPRTISRSASAMLDVARGALSLGRFEQAEASAARALELARVNSAHEVLFEGDVVQEEIRAAINADRVIHAPPPRPVEKFTEVLVEKMGMAPVPV